MHRIRGHGTGSLRRNGEPSQTEGPTQCVMNHGFAPQRSPPDGCEVSRFRKSVLNLVLIYQVGNVFRPYCVSAL